MGEDGRRKRGGWMRKGVIWWRVVREDKQETRGSSLSAWRTAAAGAWRKNRKARQKWNRWSGGGEEGREQVKWTLFIEQQMCCWRDGGEEKVEIWKAKGVCGWVCHIEVVCLCGRQLERWCTVPTWGNAAPWGAAWIEQPSAEFSDGPQLSDSTFCH